MSTRLVEFTRFAIAPPPSLPREKRYLLEIEFAAYLDNRESRSTWRLVLQFADVRGYTILARRKSLFLSRPAPSLRRSSSREAFVSGSTLDEEERAFLEGCGRFRVTRILSREREREREKGRRIYLYSHQIHAGARDPRTCHFPHRWLRLGKLQRSPLV